MHVGRQLARNLLQVFGHARARPVEVRAILKDHEDVRIAEHGLRAHTLDARRRQQRRDDGIGDLILNHIGRLAGPFRVDDDLHVADVGQRIQRNMLQTTTPPPP